MTDAVTYDVVPRAGVIDLGKQVEGLVTRVVLPNIRRGAGTVQLVHQRSDDQKPYPVPVTEDGDKVYWIVSRLDTAYPGRGQAELQWLGVNDEVAKSVTYQTNTTRSMAEPGAVPDEPLKPYTQAVAKDCPGGEGCGGQCHGSRPECGGQCRTGGAIRCYCDGSGQECGSHRRAGRTVCPECPGGGTCSRPECRCGRDGGRSGQTSPSRSRGGQNGSADGQNRRRESCPGSKNRPGGGGGSQNRS